MWIPAAPASNRRPPSRCLGHGHWRLRRTKVEPQWSKAGYWVGGRRCEATALRLQAAGASDRALGIIMSRTGSTAAEALDRLRTLSQHEHRKLVVVAAQIIDEAVRRAQAATAATDLDPGFSLLGLAGDGRTVGSDAALRNLVQVRLGCAHRDQRLAGPTMAAHISGRIRFPGASLLTFPQFFCLTF